MKRLALGVSVLVVACTASVGQFAELPEDAGRMLEDAGQAFEDAGRAMMDAGRLLVDAGDAMPSDAAHAQDDAATGPTGPVTVACDTVFVQVATATSGFKTERTWYFAQVDVEGTPPVDVVMCGREDFGGDPPNACPDGSTCTGDTHPGYGDCQASLVAYAGGKARVECGWRTRLFNPSGDLVTSATVGTRRTSATFTVR